MKQSLKLTVLGCVALSLAATSPVAAKVIRVEVKDLEFKPAKISVKVGDTIEWSNKDLIIHTATENNDKWNVELAENSAGKMTVKDAGVIKYYCRYHPNMHGEITISK